MLLMFVVLPLLAAVAVLGMAGWFFFRSLRSPESSHRPTLSAVITYCFVGSIGLIVLDCVIRRDRLSRSALLDWPSSSVQSQITIGVRSERFSPPQPTFRWFSPSPNCDRPFRPFL